MMLMLLAVLDLAILLDDDTYMSTGSCQGLVTEPTLQNVFQFLKTGIRQRYWWECN